MEVPVSSKHKYLTTRLHVPENTHMRSQVLFLRRSACILKKRDQPDQTQNCPVKCPHVVMIPDQNRLKSLKLLAVPSKLLMMFPLTVLLLMSLRM
jgi:hypothetical protein